MDKVQHMLYERLIAAGKHFEVSMQFRRLKTDQERIVFTLNLMQEYGIVPSTTGRPKNAEESEKLRVKGNKIFVTGILNDMICMNVLKLYTKSIAFAPYPSEQLARGYANRSAVLFKLGLYLECIQDINRALALNYPDNLRVKLYLRKTELNTGNTRAKIEDIPDLPVIESCNNEVPCASDAVAIKYNMHYGRHVVATRKIHPGEVIAVEKPYSLILVQENMQTHCSNCLRVCWANIPCNYCTYAMYCSEECRNIEWEKCHDIECAVFSIVLEYLTYNFDLCSIRLAVLALREAGGIEELRTMLKEIDEHDDPRTRGFSRDGKLHSDKYIGVYSLVTNSEKRSVSDLFKRTFDTSFIVYFLATRTVIFGAKLPEDLSGLANNNDVIFIGSLILRHQQIIPSNMHSFGEVQGLEYVERGIACMPFFSLINHSCNPNILRHSRSEHIVMYAMYPIEKDEQLFDNYGKHYAVMPKVTRQRKLYEQYYFVCNCIPCQQDWPLYSILRSYETLVERPEDKAIIKKALKKFNTYVDLATIGNVPNRSDIIKDLLKMVQVLHDHAPMPCEEMSNVIETLKRIYDFNGNVCEIPHLQK
ncbi:SET and MYND domain-containing protein 4 [Cyphomyrmex costatus]|uniref:Protein-lysine N-methyltransferase SMYD4 n=1 Tax=Cyphomyrmex costatus TaxID=456900 RepID=A0A151IF32_9HYME|nr:SET and MYND domain-containing protein 4 [Cyphomyrmex costatus]